MTGDLRTHASAAGEPETLRVAPAAPDPDRGVGAAKARRLWPRHDAVLGRAACGDAHRQEPRPMAVPRSVEEACSRRRNADETEGKRAERSAPVGHLNATRYRARGSVRKNCLSTRKVFIAK